MCNNTFLSFSLSLLSLLYLRRIATGQSVDDHVMREILVDLLTAVGKETLLRENGGECTFGHSWAVRFRKRHNLPTKDQNARKRKRVLTTGEDGGELVFLCCVRCVFWYVFCVEWVSYDCYFDAT